MTEQEKVLKRYSDRIAYYWRASRSNKRAYKVVRYLTIVFGAVVTLMASLSSAQFVQETPWETVFAIATPILAASLAIIGGISQTFQWGAAWRDMVVTATRLEYECDRLSVLPQGERDPVAEMETLNRIVLDETQGFFQRLFGAVSAEKGKPA